MREIIVKDFKSCAECPFYKETSYQCHGESGRHCSCALGVIQGDTRGQSYENKKYKQCNVNKVTIT